MTSPARERLRPGEAIAGLLASSACLLGLLELVYRPFRMAPAAVIFLLIATVMSRDQQRLIKIGFAIVGICFIVGASLQILTRHPLY